MQTLKQKCIKKYKKGWPNNETMQPITALNRLGTPSILFKKLDENDETAIFCKFWSKGGYFEDAEI